MAALLEEDRGGDAPTGHDISLPAQCVIGAAILASPANISSSVKPGVVLPGMRCRSGLLELGPRCNFPALDTLLSTNPRTCARSGWPDRIDKCPCKG